MVIVAAVAAAIVPWPAALVERWYSRGIYPLWQRQMTAASNLLPIAFLDVAAAALLVLGAALVVRRLRQHGWRRAGPGIVLRVLMTGAVLYLVFLASWGLNYRRIALEKQVSFDPGAVTTASLVARTASAVERINAGYAASRRPADPDALAAAFHDAQRALGGEVPARTGRAKWSVLSWYFRWAAIDGMTDPYFLEIIVNPDVLPFERPFVTAHEWAHLAGYADEAAANFVAWVTCVRADPGARYSGWLALYAHLWTALPPEHRRELAARLAEGPRQDLAAVARRLDRSTPVVRTAARDVYDSYLKANRVEQGIASYDDVVRLVLGTRFEDDWTPVRAR